MSITTIRRGAMPLMLAAALLSCDGDEGGDGGGTTGPTGSITIAVTPAALTVQQGSTGELTLALTRGGGFTGAVAVTAEGLPSGVTATISPSTLTGSTSSATVSVTVAVTMAPGAYTATLRATAQGLAESTASYAITVSAAPSYTLTLAPTALSLQQGATGAVAVTLARTNFAGTVTLSLDTPPAGVTGQFTPVTVNADNAALVVSVGSAVPAGTYTLTVRATAGGLADRTATIALTVTAPPSIAISITPPNVTVTQGGSGEVTVAITRTNLTGAVTLTASGAPPGLSLVFDQNPTSAAQVRLAFNAAGATTVATYTITVTAQAPNAQTVTATFTIQVQAAVSNQLEFQFCSSSDNPVFFAARDGSGAWQVVGGTLSGGVYRYRFTLSQPTGGVFYVQQSGSAVVSGSTSGGNVSPWSHLSTRILPDALARIPLAAASQDDVAIDYETTVLFATAGELATVGLESCPATSATRTAWLQVAGVGNGQEATLSLGGATRVFDGTTGLSPVQFTGVRWGTIDFFGTRFSQLTGVPNRLMDVRNLNPADGSTLPFTADFNSTNGYDPAAAQFTVLNALGDEITHAATFTTGNGEVGVLGLSLAPSTATTRTWYGVPSARLQSGDLHTIMIHATPPASAGSEERYHLQFTRNVQNLTPALGARLTAPTITTVGSASYRRIRAQGTIPVEYNSIISISYQVTGGGNEVWLIATNGYLAATGNATAYDLVTPDLTSLDGFPVASALPAGVWEVVANTAGLSGVGILSPAPADGASMRGAIRSVTLAVP